MALTNEQRRHVADVLREAELNRIPVEPISGTYPTMDIEDAYAIQTINIERRLLAGATIVGRKVGLTGAKMQDMHGLNQYDYGVLLDDMVEQVGGSVDISRFCTPRVEIEIAFLLAQPLVGPGVTAADVRAATQAVAPAIELIDSRIVDWRISLVDTIADNASSCGLALGPWSPLGDLSLPDVRAELIIDGEVVCDGTGADVMGDPAESVAWLANTCATYGLHLEAGQIVLTGSCTRAVDVRPGSQVEGLFTDLGSVTLNFE